MSNSFNKTDFNSSAGKGIEKALTQIIIYSSEAVKIFVTFIKDLVLTALGKK